MRKIMESFEFKSVEKWFVHKNQQMPTDKDRQTTRKRKFGGIFNSTAEVLCIKSAKKCHKILAHKTHQAPTGFL